MSVLSFWSWQPLSKPPIHADCANYRDGVCSVTGSRVDPNGPACSMFVPKTAPSTAYPLTPYQYYSPLAMPPLPPWMFMFPWWMLMPPWWMWLWF